MNRTGKIIRSKNRKELIRNRRIIGKKKVLTIADKDFQNYKSYIIG
jgi:hypothetical protein